jgi:hypothetical protein
MTQVSKADEPSWPMLRDLPPGMVSVQTWPDRDGRGEAPPRGENA